MNLTKKIAFRLLILSLTTTLFVGCNKPRNYKDSSRATGWSLNSKEGGPQKNSKYQEQETGPGLVFVEGGTFTMGKVQDDPMHDWNNSPNQQHVQSFYMDETEVTNYMYLQYLDWIKEVFPPENENYRKIYEGALPDTLVWRNRLGYNEVMTNNYLRHPAYAEYPVVGVSWIQDRIWVAWAPTARCRGLRRLRRTIRPWLPRSSFGPLGSCGLRMLPPVMGSCPCLSASAGLLF